MKFLRRQPSQRYMLLKKYEGFVTARGEDGFSARLFENSGGFPAIEAEFDLAELSETDQELAVEGASLVWTIGYAYEGATRVRQSLIYMRRLQPWTDAELQKAKLEAENLTSGIEWQ